MSEYGDINGIHGDLDTALEMCGNAQSAATVGRQGCDRANEATDTFLIKVAALEENDLVTMADETAGIASGVSAAWSTSATIVEMLESVTEGSTRAESVLAPAAELVALAGNLRETADNYREHDAAIRQALSGLIAAIKSTAESRNEIKGQFDSFELQVHVVVDAIWQYKTGT
jgi:hypothetical protein